MTPAPISSSSAAKTIRLRLTLVCAVRPSRSATIGAMRVARSAGTRLASTVTTTPTPSATMIVRGRITEAVEGRSPPMSFSRPRRPGASSSPPSSPSTEASRPITPASSTTERRTWRRDAPSVRSRPSSRVRWATVIVNVL